jgi:hypothetical protein
MRDGTAPNALTANLDINHFYLQNVKVPAADDPESPVRLMDLQAAMPSLGGSSLTSLASSVGAGMVGFINLPTGSVLRTIQSRLRDTVTIKDFNAKGDGTTDDTAPVTSANTAGVPVFFSPGTYLTTLAASALNGPFYGFGQIKDSSGNKRGAWFTQAKAAPSSLGDFNNIDTAFNGDLSKVLLPIEHRITGVNTLGSPTTGYLYTRETSAAVIYSRNDSGHNESTSSNVGRTAGVVIAGKIDQYGQGDHVFMSVAGFINGAKPGATNFLANPAISMVNGTFTAGAHGVFLNPFEADLQLGAFDAAAIGHVTNITRTVGDTANGLGALTAGYRAQSKGTYPVDAAFSASGLFKYALDTTPMTMTTDKAAIVLKQGDRIYGNSSSSDGMKATSLGSDFISRGSDGFWNFVYNNVTAFQINDVELNMIVPPKFPVVTTSQLPTPNTTNKGMEYYVSDANATTTRTAVVGGGTNFVKVFCTGTQWLIAH